MSESEFGSGSGSGSGSESESESIVLCLLRYRLPLRIRKQAMSLLWKETLRGERLGIAERDLCILMYVCMYVYGSKRDRGCT
jgi:hypothetical protein